MEKHTYREYLIWMEYLNQELNNPSRTDYYLMQVAQAITSLFKKDKRGITLDKFVLTFKPQRPKSKEQLAAESKASWMQILSSKNKGKK